MVGIYSYYNFMFFKYKVVNHCCLKPINLLSKFNNKLTGCAYRKLYIPETLKKLICHITSL